MTVKTSNLSVEERLALVESAVADLQKQIPKDTQGNWLEQITGTFKDDPVFEEILRYGREYRESHYPDYCQPDSQ